MTASHVRTADPFVNMGDHLHDVARLTEDAAIRAAHDESWTTADSTGALVRAAAVLRTVGVLLHSAEPPLRR